MLRYKQKCLNGTYFNTQYSNVFPKLKLYLKNIHSIKTFGVMSPFLHQLLRYKNYVAKKA